MTAQKATPPAVTIAEALALALREQRAGRLDIAEKIYRKVLQAEPGHHSALHLVGMIAYRRKNYADAIRWIERAIALHSTEANYHNTLGVCLRAMGSLDAAIGSYERALELTPDNVQASSNLGNALKEAREYERAIACYERACTLAPPTAALHAGLAHTLVDAGRPADAIQHYRAALALQPDDAKIHFGHALSLLMDGRLAEGWPEYEWRIESHAKAMGVHREFAQPRWSGGDLADQRLLVHCEQGFGDALQFVRYAPLLAARGARVIVECRPELKRLFALLPAAEAVLARGEALPAFDTHCPLLSLPGAFGTTLESLPADIPYLRADWAAAQAWRERMRNDIALKVGLVWSGSPTNRLNLRKACPPDQLRTLAGVEGVSFYSLQKGPAVAGDAASAVAMIDWTADLHDFADTAALVENLDLVISIDTAVAHLAGALGKPVWLLLSSEGDWRWLLDRAGSPWYPTMKIFRQCSPGDWAGVLGHVRSELAALAAR